MKLLIIANARPDQMGGYLTSAADELRLDYHLLDADKAETTNPYMQKFYWRLRGKRPANLARFAADALETCKAMKPDIVLTTGGRAPLERSHIEKLCRSGVKVINYSTDDPWNPVLSAPWFLNALPSYSAVFTPRRSNLDNFRQCGVRNLYYLPFAYDPSVHRPLSNGEPCGGPSDVLFVGGCDADRLPLIDALIDAGLRPALFGRYWNDHPKTRAHWRGVSDQDTIRAASASASICLCLVRRANRDGHVMRSFEAAAMGGCILAEDTADHRDIFGQNDVAVRYFDTVPRLVQQAKDLIADANARRNLSLRLRERMASRSDTYADRLAAMLRQAQIPNLLTNMISENFAIAL